MISWVGLHQPTGVIKCAIIVDSYSDLKEKIGYNAKDLRVYYLESGKSEERTKYREYAPGVSISIKVNTTLYAGWHKD